MKNAILFLLLFTFFASFSQRARDGYTVDVSTANCGGGLNPSNPCIRVKIEYDNDNPLTGFPENCPDSPRGLQNALYVRQDSQNYQYILLFDEEFQSLGVVSPGQIRPSTAAPANSPVWNYNWDIYAYNSTNPDKQAANAFLDTTLASFLLSPDVNQGNSCGAATDNKLRLRIDSARINDAKIFTMAVLKSRYAFRYGYIEARIRIPKGKGLLPAFWTYDASFCPNGGFEGYNEFDVFEFFQAENMYAERPRDYHRQFITQHRTLDSCSTGNLADPSAIVVPFDDASLMGGYYLDMSKDFFIYGMEWTEERVKYYLNNQLVHEHPNGNNELYQRIWLQNTLLSYGGQVPIDEFTPFPNFLEVDYVRAYKTKAQWENLIWGEGEVLKGRSLTMRADYIPGATYTWLMTTNSTNAPITLSPFLNHQWCSGGVKVGVPAATPAGDYKLQLSVTLRDGTILPPTSKTIRVLAEPERK